MDARCVSYAYADPIVASSVTSDMVTEDGLVGSIDGSSATITVGRTGDGDTPRLQRATPSEWSFAYGTYLKSSVPLANIHITNGKAIVRGGTLHDAENGTYIELTRAVLRAWRTARRRPRAARFRLT